MDRIEKLVRSIPQMRIWVEEAKKIYDGPTGITTTLSDGIVTPSVFEIEISNVENFNFEIGDFLQIDDELLRIKSTVTGNPVSVFRGVLSTEAQLTRLEVL